MKQQAKLWPVWVAAEEECTYRTVKLTVERFICTLFVQAACWNCSYAEICGCGWGWVRHWGCVIQLRFVVDGVQTKVRAKENSLAQAHPNK